ncbi:MAG: type II toxin-antitoxin system PemK/MazF family toxin [Patescibacteria group bacterium]|nr:type II toxin-antitoxin system PemK/MazF family toxin [Patescibacteria group bacterium]
MEEVLKRFVSWIKIKVKIHVSDRLVYFREGEIWWVNLGANVGHEEEGKNDNFERPVLVLKKFNKHLLWAVPTTTKTKEENPYYYQYELGGIEYAVILPQLRALSSKRLIRKVGIFPLVDFEKIREEMQKLI